MHATLCATVEKAPVGAAHKDYVCAASTGDTGEGLAMYDAGMSHFQSEQFQAALPMLQGANKHCVFGSAYALGIMRKHGYGCLKDANAAYVLFRQSSRRGHSIAGYECALMLHNIDAHRTTDVQDALAFKLFLAAALGTARCPPVLHAQSMVGECYLQGRGVAQNYEKAFESFTQHRQTCHDESDTVAEALRLSSSSAFFLGAMHMQGLGMGVSAAKADFFFNEATLGSLHQ